MIHSYCISVFIYFVTELHLDHLGQTVCVIQCTTAECWKSGEKQTDEVTQYVGFPETNWTSSVAMGAENDGWSHWGWGGGWFNCEILEKITQEGKRMQREQGTGREWEQKAEWRMGHIGLSVARRPEHTHTEVMKVFINTQTGYSVFGASSVRTEAKVRDKQIWNATCIWSYFRKKGRKKDMPQRLPNLCLKPHSLKSADFDCTVPLFTSKGSCFLSAVI